ncbi:EAL domain-containing protein [Cohnella sp. WQ 127256]|uniref:EAL domain-containing protein n=1 Tax=Cohnella sp. WQ 127256 TaxID=2938790 RepID=UPI0021192521|nr:EAL domain-containing protein [Cohnella sp. WQ 127256]
MPRYHSALFSVPLRDAGLVEFAADDLGTLSVIRDVIVECSHSDKFPAEERSDQELTLRYEDQKRLLHLLSKLQHKLQPKHAQGAQCRISYHDDDVGEGDVKQANTAIDNNERGWIPLSELFGEVGGRSVSDYILHRMFTTYLQPIVQPSGDIVGYEFLLRPLPEQVPFRPKELFATARKIGQHSFLDRAARHSAIRMSASHLQSGMKRFINFLPSSLHHPTTCLRDTFDMMRMTDTDPTDYVFEVMESEPLDDPRLIDVFDTYRSEGVRLALDDVGTGFATLDVVDRLQPDYVKIDRRWISQCENNPVKQRYIDDLIARVSQFNGVLLAEGVERHEEWDYLRKAGVSLFQGYLFGHAKPVPTPIAASAL